MARGLTRADHHASTGSLATSQRAAEHDGLAGHDRGLGVPDVHGVRVHDPRHHLLVGVDVGRRHVLVRPDGVDDLGDVAAGERLDFATRHPRRVADDSAFAAAEGDLRDGALPGHPRRQRRDFIQADIGVIADAAFGRAEADVVLDAVAGEDFDLAAVHLNRARHDDLPLGRRQDLPDARLEVHQTGGAVELLQHRTKNASRARHVRSSLWRPWRRWL